MKFFEKIKKPLIFIVLAGMMVGYFIYLNNRKVDNNEELVNDDSVAYSILSRDLERNYPSTPRSVVSFYADIIKIIYKEKLTEEELEGVAGQLLALYDEKLLVFNNEQMYKESLASEIEEYKTKEMFVSEVIVEDGGNIEYKKSEGDSYAFVDAKLFMRVGSTLSPIYEEFSLRKDSDGKWKIVTWYSVDASVMEE